MTEIRAVSEAEIGDIIGFVSGLKVRNLITFTFIPPLFYTRHSQLEF